MRNLMFRLANTLTGMGTGLMDINGTDGDLYKDDTAIGAAYESFKAAVSTVLVIVLIILLSVGVFYGISLGIKFAKAEDADARDKVKQQLINLAIGIGVATVIIVVCSVLVKNDVFKTLDIFSTTNT